MADTKFKQTKTQCGSKILTKAKSILRLIFVHNILYKLLAIGTALLCWFLTVWLNG